MFLGCRFLGNRAADRRGDFAIGGGLNNDGTATLINCAFVDKAARYLPDQNLLLINADFRTFSDMIQHWLDRYKREHGDSPGLRERIRDSVHDWFQQSLVETVIGVQALKGSREWSIKSIEAALSEEARTAAVMPRYHPYNSIKRELGTQIGPLKAKA